MPALMLGYKGRQTNLTYFIKINRVYIQLKFIYLTSSISLNHYSVKEMRRLTLAILCTLTGITLQAQQIHPERIDREQQKTKAVSTNSLKSKGANQTVKATSKSVVQGKAKAALCYPLATQQSRKSGASGSKGKQTSSAIIWSEDFSGGIPSGWSHNSSPSKAKWEYRGPTTTPDTGTGSRGAFATGNPINSPTQANGFIIFDSDYYDNGGNPANQGFGPAPTPHTGALETGSINLTGHPNVELKLNAAARNFDSRFLIAVSKNGGTTYPDTFTVFNPAINASIPNGASYSVDISSSAGNQSNVKLQFIFDGATGPAQGTPGYYFWMIDDLELRDLVQHELRFYQPDANTRLFTGNNGDPVYSHYNTAQLNSSINGQFAVLNFGSQDQKNLKGILEVWDNSNNTRVHRSSTTLATTLKSKATYIPTSNLWTNSWTPANSGIYDVVYKVTSDSIGSGLPGKAITDTFTIAVSDTVFGLDDGSVNNYFGTNSLANGTVTGVANLYITSKKSILKAVQIALGPNTDPNGSLTFEVYDTTNFFNASSTPLFSGVLNLNSQYVGRLSSINLSAIPKSSRTLAPGAYYLKVNLNPTAGNEITIANSATWPQPGLSSLMQSNTGNYFTGFTGSRAFESPMLRMVLDTTVSSGGGGGSTTVFWSEDFSSGIPSGWSHNSSPSKAKWEYRGPTTSPDTGTGSRGAFATGNPINSPTQANGFIIFDSDYYDNGGNPANQGFGPAPTPHTGALETSTINLSGHSNVELKMNAAARNFDSRFLIAISRNGGTTYPDTIVAFNPAVNGSIPNGANVTWDISSAAGNQSNVKLQFIFDGATGPAQGTPGYYFWMIDDLEIRKVKDHQLEFFGPNTLTKLTTGGPNDPIYSHYNLQLQSSVNGEFGVFNYGVKPQSNVKGTMEVWNQATNNRVHSATTTITQNLNSKGTFIPANNFWSNPWKPSKPGTYDIVYKITSDSIGPGLPGTPATDTFQIIVSKDLYGLDDGILSNYVGTNSLASGTITGMVNMYSFNDSAVIDGAEILLGPGTDANGDIEIEIYDTTNFFNAGSTPIFTQLYSLSSSNVGALSRFSFQGSGPNNGVSLASGTYYLKVNFFPTAGNEITVGNSSSWNQPGLSSLMQTSAGNYFTGFTGSRSFESPFIRMVIDTNFSTIPCTVTNRLSATICDTFVTANGNIYTSPGVYRDTLAGSSGCDSIVILNLTPGKIDSTFISPNSCGAYKVPSGDTTLFQSTSYVDTLKKVTGCDSLLFINLTVNPNLSISRTGDTLVAAAQGALYQWLDCNNGYASLSGATNRNLVLQSTGSFAVEITKNGCTDTSRCFIVNSIGLEADLLQKQIKAYPNPSSGRVTVDLGQIISRFQLKLIGIDGKTILHKHYENLSEVEFSLPETRGVYILKINTSNGETAHFRLIRK